MARIFNIYFPHGDVVHTAVVSVRKTPFFTEYVLNIADEELLDLLPGNKIISRSPDQFRFKDADAETSSELMNAIIRAVSEHLHATEA